MHSTKRSRALINLTLTAVLSLTSALPTQQGPASPTPPNSAFCLRREGRRLIPIIDWQLF